MNFTKYVTVIGVVWAFSSCAIIQQKEKKESVKVVKKVALADNIQPKLREDTLTIAFEESFYDDLARSVVEVDLDELYASFESIPDGDLPVFSKEEVEFQVNSMGGAVRIHYNDKIQSYINRLTSKGGRKYVSKMLALSQLYFPIMERILEEEGVPQELKYAAVVESALIPNIISRAGAVGLWQFMYRTGEHYRLEINSKVDERCDIFASTRASAKYMRALYETYGDWLMVLAAYNCGPGNVNKAIARTGGHDFWSIYKALPLETRRHIPKYIATYYAFHYHKDLMIAPMRDMVKYTDVKTVSVDKPIHLEQVAKVLNIEEKDLAALNRNFLKGYIPARRKTYQLVLPAQEAGLFSTYNEDIYAYNRGEYFSNGGKMIAQKKDFYPAYGTVGNGSGITYKVRRGDELGKIAKRYGTTVKNIRRWNRLRSNRVWIGQKLKLYSSKKYVPKTTLKRNSKKNVKLPYLPNKYVYHTVRKNENCWSISQKYEGVTQEKIVELNQLSNPKALRAGQKLRIKKKS